MQTYLLLIIAMDLLCLAYQEYEQDDGDAE